MIDRQKQNLVWLAGFDSLDDPHPFLDNVHSHMSKDLRDGLRELPRVFMNWLESKPYASWLIMKNAPSIEVFKARSREAQSRIVVPVQNIVSIDFSKRRSA